MSNPVIVIDAAMIGAANAKAATVKGRTDVDRIAASAFGRYLTHGRQAKHLRDGQVRTPSPVDAQGGEKLTQELRSAQQAATAAAIEYMAACITMGEQPEAITKRLIRLI
jgi:hypothetical protein